MKIVLIYPPPTPLLTKHTSNSGAVSGLGLLYLATHVKGDHDVTILGGNNNPIPVDEMIEQISALQPDILGISTIFSTLMISGKKIAQEIKKRFPPTTIVFGGNHATFTAKDLLKEPYADAVVKGEGEITFKELVECLDKRSSLAGIKGLVFKEGDRIMENSPREPIADIDAIPFPDWKLVLDTMPTSIPMCSSRGCPHDCIYCSTTSFWTRKWRSRSAQNMIDEIHSTFDRYQPENRKLEIAFVDDNFTVNRKRVLDFCRLVNQSDFTLKWACSSRVELLDEELVQAMSSTGCSELFMGIESGSIRVLEKMNRRYTPDIVRDKVQLCVEYGIIPTCSFMVGNPYEEESDVEDSFNLIHSLKSHKVQVHIFTPLIGTPVYHYPEKYGVELLSKDSEILSLESRAQLNTGHLKAKEIETLYNKGVGLVLKRYRESFLLEKIAAQNREKRKIGAKHDHQGLLNAAS